MIKFLDEGLIDNIIQEFQWKLKSDLSKQTNISAVQIMNSVRVVRFGVKRAAFENLA